MIIIGITGTLGAGKGTIAEYLTKKKGFAHFSATDFLIKEIKKRNLPINRNSMNKVANDLRAMHGPGYILEELYKEVAALDRNSVLEAVHTLGEIEVLRKHKGFYLFAIDADSKTRYLRISSRGSEKDQVSYEQFLAHEELEFASTDPAKQN